MNTNRIEAVAATAVGAASWVAPSVAQINEGLHIVAAVLGIAWWIRLWWKNPNLPPPKE